MVIMDELVGQDWEIYLPSFDDDSAWGTDYRQERNIYVGGAIIFKRDPSGQIVETQPLRGRIRFPHAPFRFGLPVEIASSTESEPEEIPVYEPGEGSEPSVNSEYRNPAEGLLIPKEEPMSPVAPPEYGLDEGLKEPAPEVPDAPPGFKWTMDELKQWNLEMQAEIQQGAETPDPSNMWAGHYADCNQDHGWK
ncbi:uncharacterized protein LOC130726091 [Lotus japonicus]|uniref:uncharacterized protein LOC130726091 n=1 Tax=Lotus japonicus TaxID=34305 RepID=UPI002590B606|nr:uncharacterized protein LOC130726091 [Lotus japonicus]